jgi:ATP-dependent DNA ligase
MSPRWTNRYPAIATAAAKLRARSFTLDGEAVVCAADGVAMFDAIHRRGTVSDPICRRSTCWNSTARTIGRFPLAGGSCA